MLVLTRRIDEVLVIGEDEGRIYIKILGMKGGQVRLGIDAPKEIPVHRQEIYLKMQQEKQSRKRQIEKELEEIEL